MTSSLDFVSKLRSDLNIQEKILLKINQIIVTTNLTALEFLDHPKLLLEFDILQQLRSTQSLRVAPF